MASIRKLLQVLPPAGPDAGFVLVLSGHFARRQDSGSARKTALSLSQHCCLTDQSEDAIRHSGVFILRLQARQGNT